MKNQLTDQLYLHREINLALNRYRFDIHQPDILWGLNAQMQRNAKAQP